LQQQASSEARDPPELVALQQQASFGAFEKAPEKLRSLLRCNNKQASFGARDPLELAALQQ